MNLSSEKTTSPTPTASDAAPASRVPVHPTPARPPRIRRRGRTVVLLLAAVLPMMAVGTVWSLSAGRHSPRTDLETYPVRIEKLDLAIVARGEVESAESSEIVCHVKSLLRNSTYSTTIKWLVEDGSLVKRGM